MEASSPTGATVTWPAPTATDLVDGPVPVDCVPASGTPFALGTTTVTCTATDDHGNSVSQTFDVVVQDTTPPEVTAPSDLPPMEASSPAGATVTYPAPTATDLVDGGVPVFCVPFSGATFALGDTTVTCTAVDNAGNSASQTFVVEVRDTSPPVVFVSDTTVEASSPTGTTVTWPAPEAIDLVDGSVPVDCDRPSGAPFALGNTTVTCTATDSAGNLASQPFVVRVLDTTPPEVTVPSAIPPVEASSPAGATVTYPAPTATDLVDGSVPVSCTPASGATFALGHTTVTCVAVDSADNLASRTFHVVVQDTTSPEVAVPSDIPPVEASSPAGATVTYPVPTATDLVDGSVPVSCVPASGTTFALGTTTVTCTATDSAGNSASRSFHVVVQDTAAPQTTITANPSNPSGSASASFSFTGSDGGGTVASFECMLDGGRSRAAPRRRAYTGLANGSHTFQVRATDAAGNVDADAGLVHLDDRHDRAGHDDHCTALGHRQQQRLQSSASAAARRSAWRVSQCKLDGGAFAACTSPHSYTRPGDGATPSRCARSTRPATPTRRRPRSPGRSTRSRRTRRSQRAPPAR